MLVAFLCIPSWLIFCDIIKRFDDQPAKRFIDPDPMEAFNSVTTATSGTCKNQPSASNKQVKTGKSTSA